MDDTESKVTLIVAVVTAVGILMAYILFKVAQAHQRVDLDVVDKQLEIQSRTSVASAVQEKIRQIPISPQYQDTAVKMIAEIVEDRTREAIKDIKQEYDVKYQVVVQEKTEELDRAKRETQNVRQQFQEVQQVFKKVEIEKKQTEAIVRSIAEGLVVVNNKGEVLLLNPSAEKLLGARKEKKIGKRIMDDVGNELMVSMARDPGDGGEKVIEFKSKDENTRKILRASSAVIQNEDGQTVGMLNILTDVTKQRELDELKNQFVSSVTHELRTPIVAMQKATALLSSSQAGPVTETQVNFLSIVSRNLGHLSRLVEDLLDVAKMESGKMRYRIVPARLDKIILDTCDTLGTWAKSKNVQMVRKLEPNFPEVPVDPDKMTQVMNNLIGNAIKFTPSGGTITVSCNWEGRGAKVKVSVADTGIGMNAADQKRLFRRFEQFGEQSGIAGTGLGLAITKEIIERHGGQILVESQEKKGSTFTFIIPTKQRPAGG